MSDSPVRRPGLTARTTAWTQRSAEPVRAFVRTESTSSVVLVASVVAALVWANANPAAYERFWATSFSLGLGERTLGRDLRTWVDSGLMTLFFLVVGLEARRELDLGDLRERRRFVLPLAAGLAGMALPVALYLAVTAGREGAHGWGVAMSTDTALALGLLSLLGRRVPSKVRVFLLTVFVVDDLVALLVIAVFYSGTIRAVPLVLAVAAYGVFLVALRLGVDRPLVYAVLGIVVWAALLESGVDPLVSGLAIGLAASAYSPGRESLERASGLFRSFREQPTAELARSAAVGLTSALSPNARLQRFYLPWVSYVVVPLFGLANAGIRLDGASLERALRSPITWGVVLGYVVGKPVAVGATTWLLDRATGGRVRPPVGWIAVLGSGTMAGMGFTVSFLIAGIALTGTEQDDAKIGVLVAVLLSAALTWLVIRAAGLLPEPARIRGLLGDSEPMLDLAVPVDPEDDHVRGPVDASVTIVEYGDFQCPHCGLAEPALVEALSQDMDIRFVWRHLPLHDVHPDAQLAAEASEAAADQGAFWPMHDLLLTRQERLAPHDLVAYAVELGLDADRFHRDLARHTHAGRVARDTEGADLSDVAGTPTFFVNGQRHYGEYDAPELVRAVAAARDRARVSARS